MAAITIDPAVLKVSTVGGDFQSGSAGEALTIGDWVYRDASRTYFKAIATDPLKATLAGVVMNNAVVGGTVYVNGSAPITTDAVFVKDTIYILSDTLGKIAPVVDLASGEVISIAGVASATTGLVMGIVNTGIVKT